MIKWIKNNRNTIIRNSFLLPILLVVIMSISHVVSWYDIGNPLSWAIYLSVAVEIFALASVSAATIKMSKGSIWFLFILVTLIQLIGNVFYEYKEISLTDLGFISWVELVTPWFDDWTILDHKRFLALIQGGTLPIMSLTSLHFYIQFNDNLEDHTTVIENKNDDTEYQTQLDDKVEEFKTEEIVTKKYKKESDTILDSTNPNDPKRYIKKTDTDYRASKGIKSGRPQKNWGK
tara:strand:- start:7652 stop:8350 length:699 start_codon:yes stop_codon:yes gene_type:complete